MRKVILCLSLLPAFSWAGVPVLTYKTAECGLSLEGQAVKVKSVSLITLTIEDHLGRFAEIQFDDEPGKLI